MGRHGGGSRGGGGGGSHGGGGSSGGGGRSSHSTTPRAGYFNRCYYTRRGRYVSYYCADPTFGTKRGITVGDVVSLVFITVHMCLMLGGFVGSALFFGQPVDGDRSNIAIYDQIDLLNERDEQSLLSLFERVYQKSGMPVFVVTDDFGWRNEFYSIEACSEYYYYTQTLDEDAMIVFFAADESKGFYDWEFDIYCGDLTEKCLSDADFDKLVEDVRKNAYSKGLTGALTAAFEDAIPEMARFKLDGDPMLLIIIPVICLFYSLFYVSIIGGIKRRNEAYEYFQQHPEAMSTVPYGYAGYVDPNITTTATPAPAGGSARKPLYYVNGEPFYGDQD